MKRVVSADGTAIAFDQEGQGHPIILVDGALCSRSLGPMLTLGPLLARHFTVFTYDRRGRGGSGNTAPYAVEREVEDLAALIKQAGGTAFVFGISSGAVLALNAASLGLPIKKLALYEAPFVVDGTRAPISKDYWALIGASIADGRRGDAVKLFLRALGAPPIVVAVMRLLPVWSKLKAVAHTLPNDGALVQEYQGGQPLPATPWGSITAPTLAIDGGKSPVWLRNGMRALTTVLPNAQHRTLEGQTHNIAAKVLAPVLREFFAGGGVAAPASPE